MHSSSQSLASAVEGGLRPRGLPMELTLRRRDNVLEGYHGGDFKVVNGQPERYLVKLSTTGRLLPWHRHPGFPVWQIDPDGVERVHTSTVRGYAKLPIRT